MNKHLVVRLALVMTTLLETTEKGGSAPASSIFLAFDHDYDLYTSVVNLGQKIGWLKVTAQSISLTPKGYSQAQKFATVV